jgi:acyl-CoA thioesterase
MTPQERAAKIGHLMYADDSAAKFFGIELVKIAPGIAEMQMLVKDDYTNGHGMCHGGMIFTLADTAFAYACNSHNQRAVAAAAAIDFLAPGQRGDTLIARAVEQHRLGRSGVYDIQVTSQTDGKLIALFRGKAHTISGTFFEESL